MTTTPTEGLLRRRLSNGVTLLVQHRAQVPAVAQVTLVKAGFLDEPDDQIGISHVLEHMLFKGTATLGPGELAQRTKALGGSLNAYTSYDRTVYYATMPARHALEIGALQADQVQRSVIDAGELERELGVIIQEAKRKLDSPDAVVGEKLHALLFQEHRIRRWRIGVEEELIGFTADLVRGYYHSRYRPDRTVVALVGSLDPAEAMAALESEWGGWQGSHELIPVGPEERTPPTNRAERFERDVSRADVVLGWRAPGTHHPDSHALELVAALLSQGRGSRLQRLLRDPGLAGGIGAAHYGTPEVGVFVIGADAEPDRLPEVVAGVGATVTALAATPPDLAEFERARTLLRVRLHRSFERYEARAIALATAEAEGDVHRLDRIEAEWLAVSTADVQRVVQQYLTPAGLAGVACLPTGSTVPFDIALLRHAGQAPATLPLVAVAPVPLRVSSGPRIHHPAQHGVHHLSLEQIDILAARHDAVPQCVLTWYGAPPPTEDPISAGTAILALRSMMRGTLTRDTSQLALAAEAMGGSLGPNVSHDLLGFGITVLEEHAATAAALLTEVVMAPRFDPAMVAVEQRLLIEDAKAVEDDMMRFPIQMMLGQAFRDRGYGSPLIGTPASVARHGVAALQQWHTHWLGSGRPTLIIVGPGDPRARAEQIANAVGNWWYSPATAAPIVQPQRIAAGQRRASRVRQQSALGMLFPGPGRNDPDRFAAELWGAIAGGLGGRLFETLRSEKSLAYTVIASSWQRRHGGGLITYIATAPERLEEAREAMLAELTRFHDAPPSGAEVERARALLIGQEEISRQTAAAWAGAIAEAWLLGNGLDELADPTAGYRTPGISEIHRVAASGFATLEHAEGVVIGTTTE